MKNLRFICFSLFTLCFSLQAFSQDEPPPPVFRVSFSNEAPKTGDIIEVILKTTVPEGMHMYSTYNKCDVVGPMKLLVTFDNASESSYSLVGEPYSVGDKRITDDVFKCDVGEFFKKAEIRQKIKVLGPKLMVIGSVEGQWCTEAKCFPFGTLIPLKFSSKELLTSGSGVPSEIIDTPALTVPVQEHVKADTTEEKPCPTCSYKKTGPSDNAPCTVKTFNGQKSETDQESNWGLFILAFLSGLTGLLTPCVFPMIPMTIAFFMKDNKKSKQSVINGLFFGVSIIFIYVVLGTIVSALLGADAGNFLSTHWIPNILFFVIFIYFSFSFFGAFEIVLPSWVTNKVDREADKGGYYGIFFMALTLAIVSFSCTGPIVGNVIVAAARGGEFEKPIIAMFGFGLAFALPFSLFAIFPHWLKQLPKSGGWLNSVKVCLGFIELALALKFLSIIDQTYHWRILDREVYLSIWIVIFALMGVYLLGKIKFSHDSNLAFLKVPRLLIVVTTFSFVVYMIPGLWGAPLKFLSGYLPPMSTQDFDINRSIREAQGITGNLCKKPKYSEDLHIAHGLNAYYDYDEAVACAKEQNKPLFIDFTGHGCVNCRKMEEKVWSDPRVLKMFNKEFVIASLYVDDKKIKLPENEHFTGRFSGQKITTLGKKNAEIEICYFGASSQPLYCLLDGKENLLQKPVGSEINGKQFDTEEFLKFLENGLAVYKKRNPKK